LERSGIGGKDILDKAGVKTLVGKSHLSLLSVLSTLSISLTDLPGVGKQYQDHYTTFSVFRARASEPTGDDWLRGVPEVQEDWMRTHATTGKGPAASNGIDAGFKIRPTEEELKDLGEPFQKAWDSYFKVRLCWRSLGGRTKLIFEWCHRKNQTSL
jgi:alcohol oxidase